MDETNRNGTSGTDKFPHEPPYRDATPLKSENREGRPLTSFISYTILCAGNGALALHANLIGLSAALVYIMLPAFADSTFMSATCQKGDTYNASAPGSIQTPSARKPASTSE